MELLVVTGGAFEGQTQDSVDFWKDVKPILESACIHCHGTNKQKGDIALHTREVSFDPGDDGPMIVAGKPDQSPLYTMTILAPEDADIMPPDSPFLSREQTEVLRKWIQNGADWPKGVVLQETPRIEFIKHIQPILETRCIGCHRSDERKGELNLDNRADAFKKGEYGSVIIPGRAEESTLYTLTVLPPDDDDIMPPKGDPLSVEQTELIKNWINQGAPWPDDITLIARKLEAEPTETEAALVADIHDFILAKEAKNRKPYTEIIPGTDISFKMVPITGGTFTMGSPRSEPKRNADEGPQHTVQIDPFWMGQYEITWDEFELFVYPKIKDADQIIAETDPEVIMVDAVSRPTPPYVDMSFGMGKYGFPAISMTQHAATKYCQWLSAKTGHFYRLPTEAEWEYACRAGTSTTYHFGNDVSELGEYAWFYDNSDGQYQKIGRKKPNPWNLYDMHGNVAEWTLDQFATEQYAKSAGSISNNPWSQITKLYPKIVRGGSWDDDPDFLRSAVRIKSNPTWKRQDPQLPKSIWYHTDAQFLGFRIIRPSRTPSRQEMVKYWTTGPLK